MPTSPMVRRAAALLLLALLAAACRRSATDDEQAATAALTIGGRAPDFSLSDLGGRTVKLSELDGRVRLIDFWATWCAPCREEIPMLNELHHSYAGQGLSILGITDERAEVVRDFAHEMGIDYTNLVDPGPVSEQYGIVALPTAILVDREGKIVHTFFGPKSRRVLEPQIRDLLGLPSA